MKRTKLSAAKNIIGKRIREARRKCRPAVSQDALAGRLAARGIPLDQAAISRIENRDRYLMDYEIAAIAKSLRVSGAWLSGEDKRSMV